MPKVIVAGQDVFYVGRASDGGRDSLLFVHGAGGTHRHWGQQLVGLRGADRYALDLPGHGRSHGPGRMSIEEYADVIIQFLDALSLQRVTVVGHSMGGAIGQHLALHSPSRVEKLVLVGSGARLRVLPSLLKGLLEDFPATVDMMLSWAYSGQTPVDVVRLGQEEWLENPPQVVHDDFAACDRFDVMGRVGEIGCPTLVICGEDDRLTPAKYAHYLRENIPQATLAIIPQAGHMVMVEQGEAVNRAIEDFLTGTAPQVSR
jgi:pimeloyl-ACP methyl ester carboxylesterase